LFKLWPITIIIKMQDSEGLSAHRIPLLDAEATPTGAIEPPTKLPGDDGVAGMFSRRRMQVLLLLAVVCGLRPLPHFFLEPNYVLPSFQAYGQLCALRIMLSVAIIPIADEFQYGDRAEGLIGSSFFIGAQTISLTVRRARI
jgi:hypothetical protein